MRLTTMIQSTALVSILLFLAAGSVGCTSTTPIAFQAPPGTVLFVDGKPHHLPGAVTFSHPKSAGESKRHTVSLVSSVQQQELRASGYIDVFGYTESDLDKQVFSTCVLDEANLARINENTTVVFRGETASRQHLYDLSLKKP